MPYQDPDPVDPMTLQGIVVETDAPGAQREMAACFVEEYLRLGFDRGRLLKLFKTPGYIGPYIAHGALGEEAILGLIDEHMRRWGPGRRLAPPNDSDDRHGRQPNGDLSLPVLG